MVIFPQTLHESTRVYENLRRVYKALQSNFRKAHFYWSFWLRSLLQTSTLCIKRLSTFMEFIMGFIAAVGLKIGDKLLDWGVEGAGSWIKNRFKKTPTIEELKKKVQVLFVDDETFEGRLSAIRDAGWNVRQIKDITNFDSEEIKNADIIFMDYKGVGSVLTPTEEGIGLLKQLKKKYPSKVVIFYSGYAGTIPGHEFHRIADGWIAKNADTFQYIENIEEFAKEIYG